MRAFSASVLISSVRKYGASGSAPPTRLVFSFIESEYDGLICSCWAKRPMSTNSTSIAKEDAPSRAISGTSPEKRPFLIPSPANVPLSSVRLSALRSPTSRACASPLNPVGTFSPSTPRGLASPARSRASMVNGMLNCTSGPIGPIVPSALSVIEEDTNSNLRSMSST